MLPFFVDFRQKKLKSHFIADYTPLVEVYKESDQCCQPILIDHAEEQFTDKFHFFYEIL